MLGALLGLFLAGQLPEEPFSMRVVTSGFEFPYEVIWGPDDLLWVTERAGKRVVRVDPIDGSRRVALTLPEVHQSAGQDGLLGMALHPELLKGTGQDFVYLAFTYDADPGDALDRRIAIRRYTWNAVKGALDRPVDLIAGLPGSNDHNSARLIVGPDRRLYYSIGDQGHNQYLNVCKPIESQRLPTAAEVAAADWTAYQGKILRLELDGSIPTDNPEMEGVQSHVFSYGHRNAQGLAFGPDGTLYAAEHGPKTDDELNVIVPGRNYGWPHVVGHRDGQAYVYGNWSASSPTPCSELTHSDLEIPDSVPQQEELDWWHPDFAPPLATYYTVPDDYDFTDPACPGTGAYICWPTIAPSSLAYYGLDGIPGWSGSLLVATLKKGAIYRVELATDGHLDGPAIPLFRTVNRYRDLAIRPDGRAIYVVTDNAGNTSGPTGGATTDLENRGAVLEFSARSTHSPPRP